MMKSRLCVFAGVALLIGCIPDQGVDYVPDSGADSGMEMDSETPGEGGSTSDGPVAAEENVMVVGVMNKFWFTVDMKPTGTDPNTFYVKPNTLVHFTLQTSPNEEAHTFQVVIPGDGTAMSKMGLPGSETHLDWTSPSMAQTYPGGIICTVHADMKSDVVVAP